MKQTERVLYISVILIITGASISSRNSNRKNLDSNSYSAERLAISQNYIRKNEIASNGCDIDPNIILQDSQLDTLQFEDLASSPGLIIKLNDSDCSVCVDSLYLCLKESFKYFTDKTGFNFYSIINGELDFPTAKKNL